MRKQICSMLMLLSAALVALGCAPAPASDTASAGGDGSTGSITLNVFAAASLTNAFSDIGKSFSAANPGTEVIFNFAGSNQLAAQIGEGAPADVFAAANGAQMNAAIASGRIISGAERTFVHNRLVVVTPGDNPAALAGLSDLAAPGLKLVFAAKEVPVGQYALDFLDKAQAAGELGAGYKEAVMANVVSYEVNVRAVLSKVILGEADAGIVYRSDVAALVGADAQIGEVQQIDIPDNLNTIASYPIAPLADSRQPELAQRFIDYILGPEGQQLLAANGFVPDNLED